MLHSFLLIGQSNMAGRGNLKDVKKISDPGIRMLRNGVWLPMEEPIHYDKNIAGVGLAASFAEKWIQNHPGEEIGLIACAQGGSSLDEWTPGGCLYDNAVNMAKLAMRTSSLDGILWHQGESDTPPELVATYYERFGKMVGSLRRHLNAEHVPLLIGGLGEYLKKCDFLRCKDNYGLLNGTLLKFALNEPDCLYVTAAGLEDKGDTLHFSALSLRIFGRRYYEAFETGQNVLAPLADEEEYATSCRPGGEEEAGEKVYRHAFEREL